MNKLFAEFLGTLTLTLAVGLSLAGEFPVSTPVLAALTVGLFVYTVGHISGTHLNPAVTIGLWSLRKIGAKDALSYIAVQVVGALAAMVIISFMVETPAELIVSGGFSVLLGELIGAFFLTFGIAAVVYGKVSKALSGAVIGGSLLLGIAVAATASNGILNPAVALALGSFSLLYLLGPILGGVLGAWAFKLVSQER